MTTLGVAFAVAVCAGPLDITEAQTDQPPEWPEGAVLTAHSITGGVRLEWPPAVDDVGIAGYIVVLNDEFRATTSETWFEDFSLPETCDVEYQVVARDTAGQLTTGNPTVNWVCDDTEPPWYPHGSSAFVYDVYETRATVEWLPAEDDRGAVAYLVEYDHAYLWVHTPRAELRDLSPAQAYTVRVFAVDLADNWGGGPTVTFGTAPNAVDADHSEFATAIEWLYGAGITNGCFDLFHFCPDRPVTRGEAASLLTRAFGLTNDTLGDRFVDDGDSIHERAINRLAAAGVTKGCNPPLNDRFCPRRPVTRGETAALLSRALLLAGDAEDAFDDDEGSPFEHPINLLAAHDITRGCNPPVGDRFCPLRPVTRGELAALLHRALAGAPLPVNYP